jgi:tRNA U55 pseudouridine synthase TruB
MGQRLGSAPHLESLHRTAVAEFEISQAHTSLCIPIFGNRL